MSSTYEATVPEGAEIGTSVAQVSATDLDSGLHGMVRLFWSWSFLVVSKGQFTLHLQTQTNGNTHRRVLLAHLLILVGACFHRFNMLILLILKCLRTDVFYNLVTVSTSLRVLVQCVLALKLSNYLAMILRILNAKFFFNFFLALFPL